MSGENQNENKFMAMLERRGIVRKVSSDDDSPATAHVGTVRLESDPPATAEAQVETNDSPYNAELNSLLQQADASIAAAQSQLDFEDETESIDASPMRPPEPPLPPQPLQVQQPPPQFETPAPTASTTSDYTPGYAAQTHPAETYAQEPVVEESPPYEQYSEEPPQRDTMFSWMGNEEATPEVPPQPVDNSTERYLDVEELYEVLSLRSKKTDTIYLIEDYIDSLPDSLPEESRRQIITKIVAASGFDYDLLMGDGILRVKMLKEYAEKFARHTDDYVEARMTEIAALERELERIHGLINDRRELHKKQFLSIEAEAGRLREILTFING